MTSNNTFQTPQTLRNFDDFNNMFKGIDSDYFTPCQIATVVLEKVEIKGDQARIDDVVEWCDNQIYFKIRDTIDERALAYAHEHRLSLPDVYNDFEDDNDFESNGDYRFDSGVSPDSDSGNWDNIEVSDIED